MKNTVTYIHAYMHKQNKQTSKNPGLHTYTYTYTHYRKTPHRGFFCTKIKLADDPPITHTHPSSLPSHLRTTLIYLPTYLLPPMLPSPQHTNPQSPIPPPPPLPLAPRHTNTHPTSHLAPRHHTHTHTNNGIRVKSRT
ncbi:hypothetical protein DM02DRAFT_89951 [Periconia macrospinosa]|uniref:Uncharacterized protein n=1 Tax=Periconia macrospinosa TaxID=97972 RepID=A0A2V1DGN8_9PLEO|nr:hypothetical protein DM02DRAFT_89951 [Periconia macrospinosa]